MNVVLESLGMLTMDLRIQKTYKALIEAFTELLEEHPYEDVTVAMLCEKAMIRRTTFYKHFVDKGAFFSFFVDSLRIDFQKRGEEYAAAKDQSHDLGAERLEVFKVLMDFLLEHEKLIENIFNSSMAGSMTNVMCDGVTEAIRERYRDVYDSGKSGVTLDAAAQFAAGGIMRLIEMWWERGHNAADEQAFIVSSDILLARVLNL